MRMLRRLGLLLGTAFYVCLPLAAPAADLPVPCAGGSCAGVPTFVTDGSATAVVNAAGTRLDVNQASDRAVLNWSQFNVAAGNTVNFNQPGANSLAVNRIFQSDPSRIFGNVTANGQIYLLNQNGILFGRGSQVNVGSLVASSLNLDPEALSGGILNPALLAQGKAAFAGDGRTVVLDQNGQPVLDANGQTIPVKVVVEEGAKITSNPKGGGRVALFGQEVANAGTIESPSGQVVLAAGQKVYLQASSDPELRGLLVEVDAGGKAWNQATGQIKSTLGNVSLVGLAVNQDGRVSATTSVQANGSVRLLARDTVSVSQAGQTVTVGTSRAGNATLGAGSVTEVTPDTATIERTAVDDQRQLPSRVDIVGRQVEFKGGSLVRVPGGQVNVSAVPNPSDRPGTAPLPADPGSRIRIESGARIDVSGSVAQVDVTRNVVEVELRANELRDSPLQRDGALRGEAVFVDIRKGTPLADVSGAIGTIARDVNERTGRGGTVSFVSRGDVVLAEGATVDVSGGAIDYRGGVIATTQLATADGRLIDIAEASPDQVYTGVLNPTVEVVNARFGTVEQRQRAGVGRFESGYREGLDAGTVQFAAPTLVVNGTLQGGVVSGPLQRTPANRAVGGRLLIGLPDGQGLDLPDFRAPSIRFADTAVPLVLNPDGSIPASWDRLELSTEYLRSGGFTRTEAYSNGTISFADSVPLGLGPDGVMRLQASVVDIGRSIRAAGGVIEARAVTVNPGVLASGSTRPGVYVRDGVSLDASGTWVNDSTSLVGRKPSTPIITDGGRVSVAVDAVGGAVELGAGVSLRADGGAWLDAKGRLTGGRGGDIAVAATGPDVALTTLGALDLSAWGVGTRASGGTLGFGANRIRIAAEGPAPGAPQSADPLSGDVPYVLRPGFFAQGSFREYRVTASGPRSATGVDPLVIAAGADLRPQQQRLQLVSDLAARPGAADVRGVSVPFLPPADVREAADLAFGYAPNARVGAANAGDVRFEAGASIRVDTGGRVAFTAPTPIRLDGRITAPAGTLTARATNPGALDQGFDPGAGIFVGGTARFDLRGVLVPTVNDSGLRVGDVRDGGRVVLTADRGRVELAAGADVDVSGAAATLDLPSVGGVSTRPATTPTLVASRGGSVDLLAPEGITLDATFRAAGGTEGVEGGRLAVGVSRQRGFVTDPDLAATFPATPREIVVGPGVAPANGVAAVDPASLATSGFDSVTLQADNAIRFSAPVALAVRNRLALQAPNIQGPGAGTVSLTANYVALGPQLRNSLTPAPATGGDATLDVRAGLIDLFGDLGLRGFGDTTLAARTDLRATGLPVISGTNASLRGSLTTAGRLTLTAAQVFPTSFSDYRIDVRAGSGSAGVLRIQPSGTVAGPALSAGGRLRLAADTIEHSGVLRAPLGELELVAGSRLDLAGGSVTATTGAGQLLPFGRVSAGSNWIYEVFPGTFAPVNAPRAQRIALTGGEVTVAAGATVDLRGGGDLYAYEFLPGPGGSIDALAVGRNPNLFAILPGGAAGFGTYDTQEYQGSALQPGDSVRLDGVPGLLPAGEYALLPARYGLLPGAVLVEALPAVRDVVAGEVRVLQDGTRVVGGQRSVIGTGLTDSRTTGFAVRPGSFGRQLAEYRDYTGNQFFAARAAAADLAVPPIARDAGALQVSVGNRLVVDGDLRLDPDAGDPSKPADDGRAGRVDLSAERLRVVQTAGSAPAGVVEVEAATIARIGTGSVLLGGTRTTTATGVDVSPVARTIEVADGVSVAANELLLVGREQVSVGTGATLRAAGTATGRAGGTLRITGNDGSAVVRVARDGQVDLSRVSGLASGDVVIGDGALLAAAGAVLVDGAGTTRSFGGYEIGPGGALAFGSRRIVLGAEAGEIADGLAVDADKLASFAALGELRLRARDTLDVQSDVVLGSTTARPTRLVIDTPLIRRLGGDAGLQAAEIVVRNTGPVEAGAPSGGTGRLSLTADRVEFGGGNVVVGGFDALTVAGRSRVTARGDATLRSGGDLTVETPLLTGAPGSDLLVSAPGRSVTLRRPAGAGPAGPSAVGAALAVEAGRISADTTLLYPAGRVRLAAETDLELGASAVVDTAGRRVRLAGEAVDLAGGTVELIGRNGSVTAAAGSRIDVSTGDGSAGAGRLAVLAGGAAILAGELAGGGPAADRSGRFSLTAGSLDGLDALAGRLVTGAFGRAVAIETLSGDLSLGAGATLRANEVTLAASGGALTVAGRVDAGGQAGGRVTLAARDDVVLASGAEVDARGTAGNGGQALLASRSGDLRLQAGSRVRLDGATGFAGGELRLRAAATADDIRIAELAGGLEGVARLLIEPVLERAVAGVLDTSAQDGFRADLDAYMAAAPDTLRSRLGAPASAALVRPVLDVVADGDLAVVDPWNLASWRWDNQPGYLVVRTTGNLGIDASVSDGFTQSGAIVSPLTAESWSLAFAAGADTASVLPLAVQGRLVDARESGSLTIGDGVVVRAGTGDIELAAANDVVLASGTSAVYTGGVAARPGQTTGGFRASWVRDGGDVRVAAGRDVSAVLPNQLLTGWNVRLNSGGRATWAVDFGRFAQGVAALGGGRIDVSAGRDVSNLAATVATTSGERPDAPGSFETWGGGDLNVEAGRDVLGGTWSTWRGNTRLTAGRAIGPGTTADFAEIAPTLAGVNGRMFLDARRGIAVGAFLHPTILPPANNQPGAAGQRRFFYNYAAEDGVILTAAAGNVTVLNDLNALDSLVPGIGSLPGIGYAPPTLRARAVGGDLVLANSLAMLPAPRAQLELIALGSVLATGFDLQMSDAAIQSLPSPTSPVEQLNAAEAPFLAAARAAIHVGDEQPAVIAAATGDVSGGAYDLAKHFRVFAGRDVRDISLTGQNTSARQSSVVQAGRDLRLGAGSASLNDRIEVAGSGRLQILVGRNVELGFSRGITSIGNTRTPALPADGAALDIWAGLGGEPDYAAFNAAYWQGQYADELTRYTAGDEDVPGLIAYVAGVTDRTDLTADNVWAAWEGLEATDQQAYLSRLRPEDQITFASFVELVDQLVSYTNLIAGRNDLTASTAVAEYLLLPVDSQRPLVQEFFFRELRDSGREANVSRTRFGFERGSQAIETLFPDRIDFAGDMSLLFSRIYTLAGGDINLLVPGGLLNVGLAVPPADQAISRQPSELGIVAQGAGRIRAFTDGDVLVNQSRVFTLRGGDIVIWSDNGNIDAGRGSKSAISAPPPVVRVDASGNVTVEFADAIAGSGIRGILTDETLDPGDVDLVAPTGEVNAGDAGIGSAGNINIAAPIVVGVDNIQVGGVSTGVPTDGGGLAAGLTGVSGLANAVAQGAQETTGGGANNGEGSLADAALALLDVLIEGYGDDQDAGRADCDPRKDANCRR